MKGEPIVILLAEDDPAHAEIVRRNLDSSHLANRLVHVSDGQAALDYLRQQGEPGIVLLDLRMPKVDGLEVLATIKADPGLSAIPVVILTTSSAEADMVQAYGSHANSYLVKPVDFQQFSALMETLGYYWLAWNEYPF
jgi:CheY-like chemotaxis protein